MNNNQHIWRVWANTLHRWGLQEVTAALLDAAGPVAILGAQFVYLWQPFVNRLLPASHLQELANLLEDGAQTRAFVTYLREDIEA